jgi:spectinomycin phosphotransferase
VPTHGEPHPGNVVRTADGLVLVDWETARLAEPERDLWLLAARTDRDVVEAYTELSGRAVDAARLRARGLRWSVVDVAGFVPTLLAAAEETPDTAWQLEALLGTLEEL